MLKVRMSSSCIFRTSGGNKTFRVSPDLTYQPLSFAVILIQEQHSYFPWEQIGFLVLCFIIKIVLSDFCHFVLLSLTQIILGDCSQGIREKIILGIEIKTHLLIMPVSFVLVFLRQLKASFLFTWRWISFTSVWSVIPSGVTQSTWFSITALLYKLHSVF